MPYTNRYESGPSFSIYFPKGVKWLLIINISVFVVYFFAVRFGGGGIFSHFALVPAAVLQTLAFWQLVSYLFLHDPGGFGHILFNMLSLWMFGADLERAWGTRRFLQFYFLCGIGAGICVILANALLPWGSMRSRTIGASGAIYGLLLAFGMLWPDRTVLFSFLFPIKAKYFVMILGGIAFMSSFAGSDNNVSHFAHLGGMVFGYIYLKRGSGSQSYYRPKRSSFMATMHHRYQDWKMQRAKKRFQVYLRKRADRDRTIH